MLMPKKTTWVLIADGARARILANHGPNTGLVPVPGTAHDNPVPKNSELVSDRPGRAFPAGGTAARAAIEPRTDWHQFEKQKFAHHIASLLDVAATDGDFDDLVMVAPPETLGELRSSLAAGTRAKVSAELPKDLTRHQLADLPGHLDGVVRL
ncbi:MAG TPA: host attachment protein [Alphaproteobacteria bacterium]|jgi:protein required for attachment to host cells